ncbi:hypothetical protein ASG57_26180 [Bradyrhizobium sp. Leaf396]|jgi:hypothetical protein|nr:hypothetical protein ASG57_26180 [Bradyrhizobium sp. Leaf396]
MSVGFQFFWTTIPRLRGQSAVGAIEFVMREADSGSPLVALKVQRAAVSISSAFTPFAAVSA